ncbi:MAG: homocysteine S-methyltransferase [Nocardioides sp.]
MSDALRNRLDSGGHVVLDGGLATRLEARGHRLSGAGLWSARLLLDDPDEIRAAHADFFRAGAEVAVTASYQVSFEAMARAGKDATETRRLLRLAVRLAREAAAESPGDRWVAASVGPYGASLGDGQEYVGDYALSVAELIEWHRPRFDALVGAQPDLLAIETIPCAAEVEAVLALVDGSGMDCWLSLTNEGLRTRRGEPLAAVFAMASEVEEIVAVGVNCCSPDGLDDVIGVALEASGKPAVAYPNSGEQWRGSEDGWRGDACFEPSSAESWRRHGAGMIGGCCRVGPTEIGRIAAILE